MADNISMQQKANAGEDPPRISGVTLLMAAVLGLIVLIFVLVLSGVMSTSPNGTTEDTPASQTGRPVGP